MFKEKLLSLLSPVYSNNHYLKQNSRVNIRKFKSFYLTLKTFKSDVISAQKLDVVYIKCQVSIVNLSKTFSDCKTIQVIHSYEKLIKF